jgi:hypothetical protein
MKIRELEKKLKKDLIQKLKGKTLREKLQLLQEEIQKSLKN